MSGRQRMVSMPWGKIELNWEVIHQTHEDYLDLNPLELADLQWVTT